VLKTKGGGTLEAGDTPCYEGRDSACFSDASSGEL